MKNKIAAYLCMGLSLCITAGCSNSNADSEVQTVDTSNFNDVIDTNTEENNSNTQSHEENADNQQNSDEKSNHQGSNGESPDNQQNNDEDFVQESNSSQPQSDSELEGSIESIENNSVVINKIFHELIADGDIAYELAGNEEVLITVYFSEETEFEVRTIKNGGVNGDDDIEKRQGAFSDLKLGATIKMTGSYDGDDFHAKYVIIYNFI